MFRRLFIAFAWLSLLLLVATGAMWVRSYSVGDELLWRWATKDERTLYEWYLSVASGRGGVGVSIDAEDYDVNAVETTDLELGETRFSRTTSRPEYPEPVFFGAAGVDGRMFALQWGHATGVSPTRRELIVPYWLIAVLLAIAPAVAARRWQLRRRRARVGHCPACGYDLRASPERCPECGRAANVGDAAR